MKKLLIISILIIQIIAYIDYVTFKAELKKDLHPIAELPPNLQKIINEE